MDPQLGMFTQPDWWEVTNPGVGTNRYAYAGGDPVNGSDPGGNENLEQSAEPKEAPWWEKLFLGVQSHEVVYSRANSAGYTDTLTNRTMSTAVNSLRLPGDGLAELLGDPKVAPYLANRADLLIRGGDGIINVFELKTEAALKDPKQRNAAAAQLAGYVAVLNAAGVKAIPGDPKNFPELFHGGDWAAGVVVGSGLLSKQTYNVIVSDSGKADGLFGYRLEQRATVETTTGEALRYLTHPDPKGLPGMMLPGPWGMPMPVPFP